MTKKTDGAGLEDRIAVIEAELAELREAGELVVVDAATVAHLEAEGKVVDLRTGKVVKSWRLVKGG